MELRPPLHLGVVAIEKGALGLTSTTVANFTFFFFLKNRQDVTNNRCRLCDDRNETINHMISKCSKLVKKEYKIRHDWVGEMIHRELYKKLKFIPTARWYMHKPEPILEN